MSLADSATDCKRLGERVEALVVETVDGLEAAPERDAHHDARTTEVVDATDDLPLGGTVLLERDTPVEIKSAAVVVTERERRGRFYFRRQQHSALLDSCGAYLFVVLAPNPARENILAMRAIPASLVDETLGNWTEPDGRAAFSQRAWTNYISARRVPSGAAEEGP
jgi:hypothetical protein